MNARQIFAVVIGAAVTIARLFSFFKREETPREREHFNHLWEVSLGAAVNGLLSDDASLSHAILPASLSMLYTFDSQALPGRDLEVAVLPPTLPGGGIIALSSNRFEDRLKKIGYQGEVPEEFIDNVITFEIMDDPVIVTTSTRNKEDREIRTNTIYDRATYKRFNGICPLSKLPFIEQKDHPELKAKIEAFVSKQEDEARLRAAISRK